MPADQAEGFKSWLVAIAGKVANAATEGGFFGFGGERVSAAETAAINELAASLGVKGLACLRLSFERPKHSSVLRLSLQRNRVQLLNRSHPFPRSIGGLPALYCSSSG